MASRFPGPASSRRTNPRNKARQTPPRSFTATEEPSFLNAGTSQQYHYTADLLALDSCKPPKAKIHTSSQLMQVTTPLAVEDWKEVLAGHPDRAFADYICEGLRSGFRIGFQYGSRLKSSAKNKKSANEQPQVMRDYLKNEISKERMLVFRNSEGLPRLHINSIGVIPKGHDTGKWRLITDMSSPWGKSVNHGINKECCRTNYITVEKVARKVSELGKGSLLAKVDVESAYRNIPVHPQDRPLLAMKWEGSIYVDPMLPFGLRSAPKIFTAVADALTWHLRQSGVCCIDHYLDDFIIVGRPQSTECAEALNIVDRECKRLGVPMAHHKREGPTTCLTFLGIEIDTEAGELRLPPEKLKRLQVLMQKFSDRTECNRKDLEELDGLFSHACQVMRNGRTFHQKMVNLLRHNHSKKIHLNAKFHADLAMWREFTNIWNGISFLKPTDLLPKVEMTASASLSVGCGAYFGNHWFRIMWGYRYPALNFKEKAIIPIIIGLVVWGEQWHGHQVLCHCDNEAVVDGLKSGTTRDTKLMGLLRCCLSLAAKYRCYIQASGSYESNNPATHLSNRRNASFFSEVPMASSKPDQIPNDLVDYLLQYEVDWASPDWCQGFSQIIRRY